MFNKNKTKNKIKKNNMIYLQFTRENFVTFMTLLKDDSVLNTDKQKNIKNGLRQIYDIEILKKGNKNQ